MSKLDELIEKLCPDRVGYKRIRDVCEVITDYTAAGSFADIAKNVKYLSNAGYAQLIRTTDLKSAFSVPEKFVYVDEHACNYLWRVNLNCEGLVLPNVGNCGEVFYITPDILPHNHNVLGPNAIWVRSNTVLNRYLYHVFSANEFQGKLAKIVSPVGQTKFNKTNFKELTIPVPPLEVQRKIIRILDNFAESTAALATELIAEIAARKKQYDYYRDELIEKACSKEGKLFLLKELSTKIVDGMHSLPKSLSDHGVYPVISAQNINNGYIDMSSNRYADELIFEKENKRTRIQSGDVLLTIVGAIGRSAVVDNQKMLFQRSICVISPNQRLICPWYLKHVLDSSTLQRWMIANAHGAAQKGLYLKQVEKIRIPIPPLEAQRAIVRLLDNFAENTVKLKIALEVELAARTKQYEYYRDKLLTFKEKKNEPV